MNITCWGAGEPIRFEAAVPGDLLMWESLGAMAFGVKLDDLKTKNAVMLLQSRADDPASARPPTRMMASELETDWLRCFREPLLAKPADTPFTPRGKKTRAAGDLIMGFDGPAVLCQTPSNLCAYSLTSGLPIYDEDKPRFDSWSLVWRDGNREHSLASFGPENWTGRMFALRSR